MNNSVDEVLKKARLLDEKDPLSLFRDQFIIEDPNVIYLDGNSLGRLPKQTINTIDEVMKNQWGSDLIDSWNKDWYNKSTVIGDKIAKLIGAEPGEVIISDNTSTNLFKLAQAAINYQKDRSVIVSDEFNFPSDLYILQGLICQNTNDIQLDLLRSKDGISMDSDVIRGQLSRDTSLVTLSHVVFKSAFMYDMTSVTKMAHDVGALMLWDLSHSVGAVPINLHESRVDLAVGCTYKYLNGGPGAPAFLFVRKELQDKLMSPIQGWFGASSPFDFSLDYQPEPGIKRFLTGTPPILSVSGIETGVDLLLEAGKDNVRNKSVKMSEFFIQLFHSELKSIGFGLSSPLTHSERGSHLSITHKEAYRISKALMDKKIDNYKIVPDFRAPDHIRFGFAPLYNTFEDIVITVKKLKSIVEKHLYENYDASRETVT